MHRSSKKPAPKNQGNKTSPHPEVCPARRHRHVPGDPDRNGLGAGTGESACQLLSLFLSDRSKGAPPLFSAYKDGVKSLNEYREQLRREAPENNFADWRGSNSLRSELDEQEIRKTVSSLRKKLKAAGPNAMALLPYLPEKGRFSLDLPRKQISVFD